MMQKVQKDPHYDFIRVFSCLCVIGIHCTKNLLFQSISRIGLPMFVFLSGALILNGKDEPIGKFYLKRIIKIIIPLYLYSLFYIYVYKYNFNISMLEPKNFLQELINITNGYTHYHLWYVYMIIGIYIYAPFLKKMCQNLTSNNCKTLLIVIFITIFIEFTLPLFGIKILTSDIELVGWTSVFLLGYLTPRLFVTQKSKNIIYTLGIISFTFSIFARIYIPTLTNINDLCITMMFQLMAVYLFFSDLKLKKIKNNIINIISHISKYTWEIYLIHVFVLDQIKNIVNYPDINSTLMDIILVISTAMVSYLLAGIIHNVITKNIQKIMNKIFKIV